MSPRAVLGQQVVIDARLVIEAFEEAGGDQLDEVAVAFRIFAEQDQMIGAAPGHFRALPIWLPIAGCRGRGAGAASVGAVGFFRALIVAAGARDVYFAADDRLHAARGGFVVEMLGGKEIAVIGDGHGGHAAAGGFVNQFRDVASAVEKTVIGVQM